MTKVDSRPFQRFLPIFHAVAVVSMSHQTFEMSVPMTPLLLFAQRQPDADPC